MELTAALKGPGRFLLYLHILMSFLLFEYKGPFFCFSTKKTGVSFLFTLYWIIRQGPFSFYLSNKIRKFSYPFLIAGMQRGGFRRDIATPSKLFQLDVKYLHKGNLSPRQSCKWNLRPWLLHSKLIGTCGCRNCMHL